MRTSPLGNLRDFTHSRKFHHVVTVSQAVARIGIGGRRYGHRRRCGTTASAAATARADTTRSGCGRSRSLAFGATHFNRSSSYPRDQRGLKRSRIFLRILEQHVNGIQMRRAAILVLVNAARCADAAGRDGAVAP